MIHQFPNDPYNKAATCANCGYLEECGGLEGEAFHKGCFARCEDHCKANGCDMACPCTPLAFSRLVDEVGGLGTRPGKRLMPFEESIPPYIPQIMHGSMRTTPLDEPWVTIPLYLVASRDQRGKYGVRFKTPEEFRNAFKVSPDTKIIVTGVGPDCYIEDFWQEHERLSILAKLHSLGIAAMTTPNYSFMRDVPRTNNIYNQTRIFRISEKISDANIPVIPHLNAITQKDWDRWIKFLIEQPAINHVCVEFQTGAKHKNFGGKYINALIHLKNSVGRDIHPIALGGGGRVLDFKANFKNFTLVDSIPFMKTTKRQLLALRGFRYKWIRKQTETGACLAKYIGAPLIMNQK